MDDGPADTAPLIPPSEFHDHLKRLAIELDANEIETLGRFLALLLETNRSFNLTSITDPGEAWIRHIADSLALVPWLVSSDAATVIDVGSGGGLPGLPLAIALPDIRFTLVESTGKKAAFLQRAVVQLDLSNVDVLNERAETLGQDQHHRARYDLALARALGRLPVLLELTVPLVKVGGHVLAVKGGQALQEVDEAKPALHLLHGAVADVARGETGIVVVIEKLRPTPRDYPRRPGEPKRLPLGS